MGLGLPTCSGWRPRPAAAPHRAGERRSVVFIFQSGGPSQHETFDPKPDAPDEIRGEYGTTQTRCPASASASTCRGWPRGPTGSPSCGRCTTPPDREFRNEHNSCTYLLHTGTTELPPGDTNASIAQPAAGPVRVAVDRLADRLRRAAGAGRRPAGRDRAAARRTRCAIPAAAPGILGPRYDRWGVDLAPPCRAPDAGRLVSRTASATTTRTTRPAPPGKGPKAWWDNSSCRDPDFRLPDLGGRRRLAAAARATAPTLLAPPGRAATATSTRDRSGASTSWDAHRAAGAAAAAGRSRPGRHNPFDLTQEPDRVRDLYGREEWGQGFLVARRLVEAGVRMVQVNLRGWDTHQNAFRDLKGKLLPSLDHCLSGFLDDLEQRGLLDETLVVMCGEMGRTPRISPISAGRQERLGRGLHAGPASLGRRLPLLLRRRRHPRRARSIGQTDRHGGVPVTEAYTPADLAATIFHLLGVGPDAEFHDTAGRPYRIYQGGPLRAARHASISTDGFSTLHRATECSETACFSGFRC